MPFNFSFKVAFEMSIKAMAMHPQPHSLLIVLSGGC